MSGIRSDVPYALCQKKYNKSFQRKSINIYLSVIDVSDTVIDGIFHKIYRFGAVIYDEF